MLTCGKADQTNLSFLTLSFPREDGFLQRTLFSLQETSKKSERKGYFTCFLNIPCLSLSGLVLQDLQSSLQHLCGAGKLPILWTLAE